MSQEVCREENVFAKKFLLPYMVEVLPGHTGFQLAGGLVNSEAHFGKAIWKYIS